MERVCCLKIGVAHHPSNSLEYALQLKNLEIPSIENGLGLETKNE